MGPFQRESQARRPDRGASRESAALADPWGGHLALPCDPHSSLAATADRAPRIVTNGPRPLGRGDILPFARALPVGAARAGHDVRRGERVWRTSPCRPSARDRWALLRGPPSDVPGRLPRRDRRPSPLSDPGDALLRP